MADWCSRSRVSWRPPSGIRRSTAMLSFYPDSGRTFLLDACRPGHRHAWWCKPMKWRQSLLCLAFNHEFGPRLPDHRDIRYICGQVSRQYRARHANRSLYRRLRHAHNQDITDPHTFTVQATYIHEKQDDKVELLYTLNGATRRASTALEPQNVADTLNTVKRADPTTSTEGYGADPRVSSPPPASAASWTRSDHRRSGEQGIHCRAELRCRSRTCV